MSVINVFFFLYSLQCKNTLIIYQLNLITMLFILDIKIHLWILGGETFFFINNEMDARSQETMHNTKVTEIRLIV